MTMLDYKYQNSLNNATPNTNLIAVRSLINLFITMWIISSQLIFIMYILSLSAAACIEKIKSRPLVSFFFNIFHVKQQKKKGGG